MPYPSITTSYTGVSTKDILQLLVLGNEAFEKGALYVHEDIDDKGIELTRMVVASDIIQPYQSMPTVPSNALTITPRRLDPVKMMLFDFINPMEFQSYWKQFQNDGPLEDKVLNPQVQAAIIDAYSKRSDNQLGRLIWQGSKALAAPSPLRYIDGIVTRAIADVNVQKTAATGALTTGNVIAAFNNLDALITDALFEDPDVVFACSTGTFRLYQQAVRALTNKGQGPAEWVPPVCNNRKILTFSGFPANYILAGKMTSNSATTNLHAAVNAEDDANNLVIQKWRPEGDLYFIKATFSLDVNYGFGEELFLSPQV
jgi:hypothetical protein